MTEGQTSGVLEGLNGAYVVQVTSLTKPDASTLDQATAGQIRSQLEQQVNQKYMSIWLEELKEEAEITDNRARVLR
jgi:parvulin-like peptidyl-prolyl isomerase